MLYQNQIDDLYRHIIGLVGREDQNLYFPPFGRGVDGVQDEVEKNLPELLALYNTIGRRTVIIYASTLIVASFLTGILVNAWLLPGFAVSVDPLHSIDLVAASSHWQPTVSAVFAATSVYLMALLGSVGAGQRIRQRFFVRTAKPSCCSSTSCCGD